MRRAAEGMKIAIIGGGFSGTAVAINLLKLANEDLAVTIVERGERVGEGAAYGTVRREHVLNVPVAKMTCIPDQPDHLYKWLEQNGASVGLEDPESRTMKTFIPREVYSQYIKSTLQKAEAESAGKLTRLRDEAVEASISGQNSVEVKLASGNSLTADRLVLCLGNEPSIWPFPKDGAPSERLIGSPWKTDYSQIPDDANVLIVGTGLTMADAVVSLHHKGHKGKITAISRRGIIPKALDPNLKPVEHHFDQKQRSAMELYTEIMERITRHTSLGGDWREAVDGLRPWTVQLWRSLSIEDKKLFISKGKTVWDFHRHRVAPEIHQVLTQAFVSGKAEVLTGHVTQLSADKDGKVLAELDQTGKEAVSQSFDYVVNCTGPNTSVLKSGNPLMQSLLREGIVQPGDSGLGIMITDDGRCIGKNGPSELFFASGPQLLDRDFEAVAVPELKQHAKTAARNALRH